jgi:hypothetical protein
MAILKLDFNTRVTRMPSEPPRDSMQAPGFSPGAILTRYRANYPHAVLRAGLCCDRVQFRAPQTLDSCPKPCIVPPNRISSEAVRLTVQLVSFPIFAIRPPVVVLR